MTDAKRAIRYDHVDDLCIITCIFNPSGLKRRLQNYLAFAKPLLESGIAFFTVECAFADCDWILAKSENVIQVRSRAVLWQKERLLNLALSHVGARFTKIVWLDCDVLFTNPNWAVITSRLLEEFPVVQPFDRAIQLSEAGMVDDGMVETMMVDEANGIQFRSFAAVKQGFEALLDGEAGGTPALPDGEAGGTPALPWGHSHGHTGLAWAARYEVLKRHGLYDAAIAGGADDFMAHAMFGEFGSTCVTELMSPAALGHFQAWAEPFYQSVKGKVGVAPGTVLSLWHGSRKERRYLERHSQLRRFHFDPHKAIALGPEGTWEWRSWNPVLHWWVRRYFASRAEDQG